MFFTINSSSDSHSQATMGTDPYDSCVYQEVIADPDDCVAVWRGLACNDEIVPDSLRPLVRSTVHKLSRIVTQTRGTIPVPASIIWAPLLKSIIRESMQELVPEVILLYVPISCFYQPPPCE